jgi:hypothetical protein
MQTIPVDIDPDQVVRWLKAELGAAPSSFRVTARRTTELREIPAREDTRLGDDEREDLSEVATVAALEIAPVHASDGWLLTVVVEDESGPRIAERAATGEPDQTVDLGAFYREFIRSGRGVASVVAEVEGPAAEARLTSLLHTIEKNRHGSSSAATKG